MQIRTSETLGIAQRTRGLGLELNVLVPNASAVHDSVLESFKASITTGEFLDIYVLGLNLGLDFDA